MSTAVKKPSIGRIVHYVLPHGSARGEHRPAIVVRVWSETTLNLQVWLDTDAYGRANDAPGSWSANLMGGRPEAAAVQWATSVVHDETQQPGTWHWPEAVG